MTSILDFLLLPILLFIGLITSYEDIKYGKVRNKWIQLGFYWGLGIFILLIIWRFLAAPLTKFFYLQILHRSAESPMPVFTFNLDFLLSSLANCALAGIIAFFIWRINAWAAGDAKLFIVFSLLIPLTKYQYSYLKIFPSFTLLINIFFIFLLYLLISSGIFYLRKTGQKIKTAGWRNFFRPAKNIKINFHPAQAGKKLITVGENLLLPFLIILFFNFAQPAIKKLWGLDIMPYQSLLFACLIIFSSQTAPWLKKPLVLKIIALMFGLICLFGLFYDSQSTLKIIWQTIKSMAVFMVFFALFRKSIDFYLKKTQTKIIELKKLQARMFVDPAILEKASLSADHNFKRSGLNNEQTEIIKKKLAEEKIETITIFRTSPFAPFMLLGALTTLWLQNSLLGIILKFFSS